MKKTPRPPPPPAVEASSSRRSQPVRQTRTNPPRTNSIPNRTFSRDSRAGGLAHDQPIEIFPAVTHFTDAITALPKEVVKHFTLLKEVDAKVHLPAQSLLRAIDEALDTPTPEPARSSDDGASSIAPTSVAMSAQNSSSGVALNGNRISDEIAQTGVFHPSNIPRRERFLRVALELKEMLVSLEEKNHVISTANEALGRQIARIDDIYPYLQDEFSDEAKWGSTMHWAYPENRAGRANNTQAERSRREGAASLSAAAQQIAEEAAARSDARKQAVALKKSLKNQQQHLESDFDDPEGKLKGEPAKKPGGAKSRKAPAEAATTVGLGISNTSTPNGNPPAKRRKVEKPTNGGAPAERAMATVFGSAAAAKPKPASPRETPIPGPEGATKKRKALPGGVSQPKKSRNGNAMSPSITSSPVVGSFPDAVKVGRNSPAPGVIRPVSSRARQNSTQSNIPENTKARPPSSASNKPNGVPLVLPELAPQSNGSRIVQEKTKEIVPPPAVEAPKPEPEVPATANAITVTAKKETVVKAVAKTDDQEAKKRESPPSIPITQTITTKSGRASKPSTPALATFAEAARSRPSRLSEAGGAKRSHKKGASAAAAAQALAAQRADADAGSGQQDEEEDPLYCYCNVVSYGEMIACDAEDCAKEWFHLDCVGLKVAPKGNVKWYCEDCKKRLKVGERKTNGR